jgi:hypothetical protein
MPVEDTERITLMETSLVFFTMAMDLLTGSGQKVCVGSKGVDLLPGLLCLYTTGLAWLYLSFHFGKMETRRY